VFAKGIVPCKIELLDNWVINSMEDLMHLGLPRDAEALLLFETVGDLETVEEEKEKIADIVSKHGAREVRMADEPGEADRYWLARRAGFASIVGRAKNVLTEDVTVPIPDLPRLIKRCREIAKKYDVQIAVLGHAGDGNLHPSILTDRGNKDLYDRSVRAMEDLIQAAIDLGGVLSGEHGIGLEKQRFVRMALEQPVIEMMKKVKTLLDPNNILNPGKIWE
jgi:glycolate oxidase